MSNNKDFKVKNSVEPTSYFEGVGSVVSTTENYAIGSARYFEQRKLSLGTITGTRTGSCVFKPDGTRLYIGKSTSGSNIFQLDLTEAWNLQSAKYENVSFLSAEESALQSFFIKPDGNKLYVIGTTGDSVYQYSLGTPWDIGTATYDSVSYSVAAQSTAPVGLVFKDDGTSFYVLHSAGVIYQYNLGTAWDLSTVFVSVSSFSVAAQDTGASEFTFKPDGTKLYVVGTTGDAVYQYTLSTPWDITTASYDSVSFSVAAQEITPNGVFFKTDGTRMYVSGDTTDTLYEYELTTPWDISTSTFPVSFYDASAVGPSSVFFKPDGTKMYVTGTSVDEVYQYSLTTSWDATTAVYDNIFISVAGQDTSPTGLFFKPDGTQMYVMGQTNDSVYQYNPPLGFSIAAQEATPEGVFFKPDGTKMYVIGRTGDSVYQYSLTTPWDTSTASYDNVSFSVAAQELNPTGLFFKPDGTKLYIIGLSGDAIYEYDLSTPWDISTATYLQGFSVSAQEASPTDLFFRPDGTRLFVIGSTGDDVNVYNVSTPWDISTASFASLAFSVATEENSPQGLSFSSDGTKMYVIGTTGDDVNEYSLSSAWDLTTASFSQSFSIGSQENLPTSVTFKPDGTKMYVIGTTNDQVYQYSLSTPWDVSTAALISDLTNAWDLTNFTYSGASFSVTTQEASPTGLFFKPDGTKMYVTGTSGRAVYEYDLSTPWNILTASFVQSFSVATEETGPQDVFLKPDGTKMYVIGVTGDDVNIYSLSTPWDISTASFDNATFSVAGQTTSPRDVFIKPDGSQMYIVGSSLGIFQYETTRTKFELDLSGGSVFNVTADGPFYVNITNPAPSGRVSSGTLVLGLTGDLGVAEFDFTLPYNRSYLPDLGTKSVYSFTTDDGGVTYSAVESIKSV